MQLDLYWYDRRSRRPPSSSTSSNASCSTISPPPTILTLTPPSSPASSTSFQELHPTAPSLRTRTGFDSSCFSHSKATLFALRRDIPLPPFISLTPQSGPISEPCSPHPAWHTLTSVHLNIHCTCLTALVTWLSPALALTAFTLRLTGLPHDGPRFAHLKLAVSLLSLQQSVKIYTPSTFVMLTIMLYEIHAFL